MNTQAKKTTTAPAATENETPVALTSDASLVENKVTDENAPIFEWRFISFDDSVKRIGSGWRAVLVEDDGKNTVRLTETTGERHRISRRVYDALPKGKTVRNNRAPRKTADTSDTSDTKAPRKRAGKGGGGDDGGKGKGGNRMDQLMDILRRTSGSTVDELAAETGGLAKHTIRGMVSQMKSKGYPVERQDKKYVATDTDKK